MIEQRTYSKKKSYIESEEVVDIETGDVRLIQRYDHVDVDINWEKVWLSNLRHAIGLVSESSVKVLMYFIDNRNYENRVYTNKQMVVRGTGVSKNTVYSAIAKLIKGDAIRSIDLGFQVNPHIIFNSQEAKRKKLSRLDVINSYYNYESAVQKEKKTFEFVGKEDKNNE